MARHTRRPRLRSAASKTLPRPVLWAIGLSAIAFLVLIFLVGLNAPNKIPGRSYYTVKAQFNYADNLTGHYQVRIGGRYVGQVLDPKAVDGKAVAQLQLDPKIGPLKSDTTLRVRPRSPIGVRFVELSPGTHGRPLADGEMLPATQTSSSTPLDTTLNTLDAKRRAEAKVLLNQLGEGTLDRGDAIQDVLATAPDSLSGLRRLTGAINRRPGAPARLVASSEGAAAAADPVRRTIRQGLRSGSNALRPFADGEPDLRATLEEAPAALSAAQEGLRSADPLLAEARGLAREALPALRPAPTGLREARQLLAESPSGLRSLRSTLDVAKTATPPTLDVLTTLRPNLPLTERTMQAALPTMDRLTAHECDLSLFTRNWTSFLEYGVPGGEKEIGPINNLRLNLLADDETIVGATTKLPTVADNAYPAPCTVTQDASTRK
jgi:ABC-type transporter Mla subunit MlaD